MTATEILEALRRPFSEDDISWRIGQCGKKKNGEIWAKVLAYLTNRAIMDRLDEVVGPNNWKNEYIVGPAGGVLCGLSVRFDGEWITKWDGAENSDIEAVKGGLSDSMKRAAVHFGIGRYLYDLGESFADIVEGKEKGSHYANCKAKVDGKEEWLTFNWKPPALSHKFVPANGDRRREEERDDDRPRQPSEKKKAATPALDDANVATFKEQVLRTKEDAEAFYGVVAMMAKNVADQPTRAKCRDFALLYRGAHFPTLDEQYVWSAFYTGRCTADTGAGLKELGQAEKAKKVTAATAKIVREKFQLAGAAA